MAEITLTYGDVNNSGQFSGRAFYARCQLRATQTRVQDGVRQYYIQARQWVYSASGYSVYPNSGGYYIFWTESEYRSWALLCDTGWYNLGWYSVGATVSRSNVGFKDVNSGGGYLYPSASYTIAAISKPTNCSATRNSDTQNTITWTNHNGSYVAAYSKILIERKTDGGSWTQIASVDFSNNVASYTDKSTSANHSYQYRVRAANALDAYSDYSNTTSTLYNTPSAPSNLNGVYATGEGSVTLTWTDNALAESGYQIQSDSTSAFSNPTQHTAAASATSFVDNNPPMGDAWYRVRAVAGDLTSAWSSAVKIVTLTNPAAPTPLSPSSGSVLDMPDSITFKWKHNPLDNTGQTAAKVFAKLSTASSYTTYTVTGSAQQLTISRPSSWVAGSQIDWYVQTKGVYSPSASTGYSPNSEVMSFYVRQAPQISITQPVPTDGGIVDRLPLTVAWIDNEPQPFTQSSATIKIVEVESGVTVWSGSVDGDTSSIEIPSSDFLPSNNMQFKVIITVNSSSTLSSTAERIFVTEYEEPKVPEAYVVPNHESATAQITVMTNDIFGQDEPTTVAVGVFRRDRNGESAIVERMEPNSTIIDYVPPLNSDFQYRAVAYAETGVVSEVFLDCRIDRVGEHFWNFGEGLKETATLFLNPNASRSGSNDAELIQYEGDEYPTVYEGTSLASSKPVSGTVYSIDQLEQFTRRLKAEKGARCIFRDPFGGVYPVSVRNITDSYSGGKGMKWQVSIEQEQVL